MAPLPDDWKILEDGEAVPFEENEAARKLRREHAAPAKEHLKSGTEADGKNYWDNPGFRKRVISALVLGPLVLAAVAAGGAVFYTLVLVAAVLMMREWDAINAHRMSDAWGWAGVLYVTATCLSFIILREETLTLIIYLLAVVWATDIGAYFAGRQIGGPKLAPSISPNKTWSGLLGGILSAVTVGGILSFFFMFPTHVTQAALVSAGLAVVAQMGDLFESWMKRRAGMKDSSNLIPGHGGVLDRVDGLTFTAPLLVALYYALTPAPDIAAAPIL